MRVWLVALPFLWSSGAIVAALLRIKHRDPLVQLALRFALGLSIWPIVFLATTQLGIAMSIVAMRVIVFATIAIGVVFVRKWRVDWWMVALAILAIVTRISHIRELSFPPWVDGVHHAMIVRLFLEHGAIPATADPYIAGAPFFYHWGFHVPATFIAAATSTFDMPSLLLQYGQVLNALSLLTIYAGARVLLRSRRAAMIAAALAMFVSYYPAFYLSWGRYTHLAGTLVLPPLLVTLSERRLSAGRQSDLRSAAGRRDAGRLIAGAPILACGLMLIHVRIALFALAFALIMLIARPSLRTLIRWSCAALLAALLASPWLIGLARNPHVSEVIAPVDRAASMELLASTHNRELLALATAGISGVIGSLSMPLLGRIASALWFIAIAIVVWRKRRAPLRVFEAMIAWVLLVTIALYWKPLTGFATLDSAIITMFFPLVMCGAALIAFVFPRKALLPIALVIAIGGAYTTRHIVNANTIFADAADLRAMRWIERNVRRDAVFAIEGRAWMPPAYVGVDGGYWLHVTTGRRTNLPPLLYAWSLPKERVDAINANVTQLRPSGATHVYVGSHGSAARRQALLATNAVKLIYRDKDVLVFEIR